MGSLFKVREYWGVKCGLEEEFDRGCLVVGNIDNEKNKGSVDKIVTGSFSGMLRVFFPRKKKNSPSDLVLEQRLDQAILQLGIGRFIPNSKDNALAVLMPKKLCVYSLTTKSFQEGENSGQGTSTMQQYQLAKQYEHELSRLSANMTFGPFGGVYGKDFICVQSFDGQLSFFEQDHFVFSRFLTNTLIPGPLCYFRASDCFITFNSSLELESYKYQVLAASSGSSEKFEQKSKSGKKIQEDWKIVLGEEVYDIKIARYSHQQPNSQSEIIVLGEKTLFCVSENGKLISQKKLDFFPSCLAVYCNSAHDSLSKQNLIVGTHNHSIMIYRDPRLIWAAGTNKLNPIAIETGNFGGMEGMIVMLDDTGSLTLNYLGTDPVVNPIPMMEHKEVDYSELESEHRRLQMIIKQHQSLSKKEPKEKLLLRVEVPNIIDNEILDDSRSGEDRSKVTVKLFVKYSGRASVENILLNISVPQPFSVSQGAIEISSLKGGTQTPVTFHVTIFGPDRKNSMIPLSLIGEVVAIYHSPKENSSNLEQRTCRHDFNLPFSLAASLASEKKTAKHKITIETNQGPVPVFSLFEDMLKGNQSMVNNVTFQYANGQDVTLLVGKNNGKYRIQSDEFEAIWMLAGETHRRLSTMKNQSQEPLQISFNDGMPFVPYFEIIDNHFECRKKLRELNSQLRNKAHQFRSVQKGLLVRFKQRDAAPLSGIDKLFEISYRELIKLSHRVEEEQEALKLASSRLSCATSLILLLMKLKLNMEEQELDILRQFLSPVVSDSEEQGWEEITDASMTHLLRTSLAKSKKESTSVPHPLSFPKDASKVKKHIALVFDRLSKGGKLYQEEKKTKEGKKSGKKSKEGTAEQK